MAITILTPLEVFGFTAPVGPYPSGDAVPQDVLCCFVTASFAPGSAYAQADDASCSGIPALIQASRRNSKTVTLVSAAGAAPGLDGAAPMIPYGCTVANGVITAALSDSTLVAEHAAANLGPCNRPMTFFVTFKEG